MGQNEFIVDLDVSADKGTLMESMEKVWKGIQAIGPNETVEDTLDRLRKSFSPTSAAFVTTEAQPEEKEIAVGAEIEVQAEKEVVSEVEDEVAQVEDEVEEAEGEAKVKEEVLVEAEETEVEATEPEVEGQVVETLWEQQEELGATFVSDVSYIFASPILCSRLTLLFLISCSSLSPIDPSFPLELYSEKSGKSKTLVRLLGPSEPISSTSEDSQRLPFTTSRLSRSLLPQLVLRLSWSAN